MPTLITVAQFIAEVEAGTISDVFSLTYGTEKRVYGKRRTMEQSLKTFEIVYAVIP